MLINSALLTLDDNLSWKKASNIRDNLISQIKEISAKEILILNLPDNFEGIYIFRNGLDRCLRFNKIKVQTKFLLSQEILKSQKFSISKNSNTVLFTSTPGNFYSIFKIKDVEAKIINNHGVLFKLHPNSHRKIYLYDGIKLKEI
jgi:hypothetical protein